MNKDDLTFYELMANEMDEIGATVEIETKEIDNVYALTMEKLHLAETTTDKIEEIDQAGEAREGQETSREMIKLETARRKGRPKKVLRLLLVAAVLLIVNMSLWAFYQSIFNDFTYIFHRNEPAKERPLDEEENRLLDEMGQVIDQKVEGELTVTLTKVLGDDHSLYLLFDVEDPTGKIDFTKCGEKPMRIRGADVILAGTGGEHGGLCQELLEKRTPHKTVFLMDCQANEHLMHQKISVRLQELIGYSQEEGAVLDLGEDNLERIYETFHETENDSKIAVLDGISLTDIHIDEEGTSFSFEIEDIDRDRQTLQHLALRNKETGQIISYMGLDRRPDSQKYIFSDLCDKKQLSNLELILDAGEKEVILSADTWLFQVELNYVNHTKEIQTDQLITRTDQGGEIIQYELKNVAISPMGITLMGTLVSENLYGPIKGKLIMADQSEIAFRAGIGNPGCGMGDTFKVAETLPHIIDVNKVEQVIIEDQLTIDVLGK